jgi:hypothetical protein
MISENLAAMMRRKDLVRLGTEEALQEADDISDAVEHAGGLTNIEVYALWGYTGKPTEEEKAARAARRDQVEALKRQPSDKLTAMRRREQLLLEGTPEARSEADQIMRAVVRAGGLSAAEAMALKSS